ncbi:aminotransferase [Daldinia bambusicola]|nr:aminotransferase [Daldinia bambusicola]
MDDFRLFTSIRYDPSLLKAPDLGHTNIGWNQNSSPFYMLDLHRDRMLRAAVHWQWSDAITRISRDEGLEYLHKFLENITGGVGSSPHRIMLSLARDGKLDYQISPLPETPLANLFPEQLPSQGSKNPDQGDNKVPTQDPVYDIFLDSQRTAKSEFTHYKTTFRDMYNEARKRTQINLGDKKEVLLINNDGHVMEGSISTPYFWRDRRWVTPPIPTQYRASGGSGGNDGTTRRWALERNLAVEEVVPADSLVNGEECWISNGLRGFIFGTVKL